MLSKIFTAGLALLSLATATPVERRAESPLKVELAATEKNAVIEATITNTGSKDLALLKLGSLLSDAPVKKVVVAKEDDSELTFNGIYLNYDLSKLSDSDYTTLAAGQTLKTEIELASVYDLSSDDSYKVSAVGTIQYKDASGEFHTTEASTPVVGVAEFKSNTLSIKVDKEAAAKVESVAKALEKRVVISSCSGTRLTALQTALSYTRSRAAAAATAATSGSSTKFSEYFKTTTSSVRSTVAARLNAVASAASSTSSGSVRYYCTDVYGYCSTNVLAWTLPSSNIIANCDIYYSDLSASTRTCHGQDQWTTTLHELTHAPGVYSPGTDDNAYGYTESISLSSSAAVLNADTYALYAQAIYLGC